MQTESPSGSPAHTNKTSPSPSELRAQFRLLVEELEEYAICILDPEGHVTGWNKGARQLTRYAEEEILGKHFSIFYPEEEVETGRSEEALSEAAQEGRWTGEGWQVCRDGSRFWARVTITALIGEKGGLQGFVKITRELTDRHRQEEPQRQQGANAEAEEARKKILETQEEGRQRPERETAREASHRSESRYRRLFEDALEGVAITSPDGAVLDTNPAAREILGYEPEDISELNVGEIYANPAERKRISAELRRTGSVRGREVRLRRKTGEEIICEISVTVRSKKEESKEEGEPEVYQTFFRDVTDRKEAVEALRESEEKFRTLAEGALVGISLIQEGRYEYVNQALAEITGYSQEELLGTSPERLVHPADWPRVHRQIERRTAGEVEKVRYETRIQTKASETRYVQVAGSRVTYQGGPAAIATIQDVTEEKQLQREVLEVQEKERRRLGQDLHDGVASQLTGARLMVDGLRLEIEDEHSDLAGRLEKVQKLVRESGENLRRVSRGLNPLVLKNGGLLAALERLAKNTDGCRLERAGPVEELSEEELTSKEETHLYWIVQEAATNAQRHGKAGEIVIRLRREEGALILEVEDDGRGFDPSESGQEGTGLRTMEYRAELLGADLTIDSTPGEGTSAHCYLPL